MDPALIEARLDALLGPGIDVAKDGRGALFLGGSYVASTAPSRGEIELLNEPGPARVGLIDIGGT